MTTPGKLKLFALIGPGVLIAATGVGAGDLATGALTGSQLGVAVLWAVVVGAALKYLLTEGLARWQLATGSTLLEGAVLHLWRPIQWLFLVYLLIWSFFVGAALISAIGVTAHAIVPLFDDIAKDKLLYGVVHSLVALLLVQIGGFKLFEKVMSFCIAIMFGVVLSTAVALQPDWKEVFTGLVYPKIPDFNGQGLQWTIALMGGVGGTLTVLCYGYWIREAGRSGGDSLKICRIDLATGYIMTALFGLAMVIIGQQVGKIDAKGASLIVTIAAELQDQLGPMGVIAKWAFLIGAWGAVFSSLLGVWQSVPYLFADFWRLVRSQGDLQNVPPVNTKSFAYQAYLFGLAIIPLLGVAFFDFKTAQLFYAIIGAFFMPMLAVVLLCLNGRTKLVGQKFRNSPSTTLLLAATLIFFVAAGFLGVQKKFFPVPKTTPPPTASATK